MPVRESYNTSGRKRKRRRQKKSSSQLSSMSLFLIATAYLFYLIPQEIHAAFWQRVLSADERPIKMPGTHAGVIKKELPLPKLSRFEDEPIDEASANTEIDKEVTTKVGY